MKIRIVYKGGIDIEVIECDNFFSHTAGGWMLESNNNGNIFISSADIRKIYREDYNVVT